MLYQVSDRFYGRKIKPSPWSFKGFFLCVVLIKTGTEKHIILQSLKFLSLFRLCAMNIQIRIYSAKNQCFGLNNEK